MKRRPNREEAGMTLIELIITVVLLSMITGVLGAAFVTSLNASANAHARVNETNDAQLIAGFLTRDAQATGGTDPATGAADTTLGVSTSDSASCSVPGTLVVRFKWIDRSATANTVRVANYSYISTSSGTFVAQQLVRAACSGPVGGTLGAPVSVALANKVLGPPGITCDVNTACYPFPNSVTMSVSESNSNGTAPYSFSLTASIRPQNTLQAVPTTPAPLMLLGRPGCGSEATTGFRIQSSIVGTVNVIGKAYVDATDVSGCKAMNVSGGFFGQYNSTETSILAGGTCTGSSCPSGSELTSYPTSIDDPYFGTPVPTGSPKSGCAGGNATPGVYAATLVVNSSSTDCTLAPGAYILHNGISITSGAELRGTGVTLYIDGGTFDANGSGGVNISAPTTGDQAGIAIWQAGTSPVQFQGSFIGFNDININGSIYAPQAQVRNSVSIFGATMNVSAIVAQTLYVNFSVFSTLNIGTPLETVTQSLPQWTVNRPGYTATVAATGGQSPYTFSIANGSLPAGLSINSGTGVISGTPTSAGTSNFNVVVTDSLGDQVSTQYSIVINPVPAIATALPNWTITFNYHDTQLSTNGTGTSPYTWAITGNLPPGLSMSTGLNAGLVTGSPTTTGSYTSTVTVTDATGATATRTYTIQINPVPTIAGPATLPTPWNANTAYPTGNTGTVTAGTGTAPFTWGENLPTGLNINASTGAITGTPTVVGTFPNSSISVTDAAGAVATQTYSITINPPLGVTSGTPPTGEQGIPYNFTVVPSGGTPPYTITATGLPAPLTMSTGGAISGTPTAPSSGSIQVTVKDATNTTTVKTYTFTIAAPVTFSGSLHDWTIGRDYQAVTLSANGGAGTRTFSAPFGGFPNGMSISTNGSVTGTPSQTGTFSPQIKILDSLGGTQTQTLTFTINPAPIIQTASLPSGERTVNYGSVPLALQPGTGTAPITWSASGTSLSASGLSLNPSTGVISGTPTAGGTFNVTINALDAAGVSATKQLTLVIAQAPTVGAGTLGDWTVNRPNYNAQLTPGAGGTGPYTFSITAGSLPAGLSLASATGLISGQPTASGTANFTVTITDSVGGTGTAAKSIKINPPPTIGTGSLPAGGLNTAYTATLAVTANTGTAPFTWTAPSLPPGLTLSTGGVISGTPTVAGTSTIALTLTDAAGATATGNLSITISAGPTITSVTLINGNNANRIDQGDQIRVVFSSQMKESSICSSWTVDTADHTISTTGVTVTVNNASPNDTITVSGSGCPTFNFGVLDLQSPSFTGGTSTFKGGFLQSNSQIQWTASTHTLLITLGTRSGTNPSTVSGTTAPIYTPGPITDTGGLALQNVPFILPSAHQF